MKTASFMKGLIIDIYFILLHLAFNDYFDLLFSY